jgi:D-3-phosphoglycerate dehydrogenase
MARVLVTDDLDEQALAELRRQAEVQYRPGLTPAELLQAIADADALVVRSGTRVTRPVIEAGMRLRVIGRAGTGTDNIDVAAATERGIWVVNAPDSNSVAVAEHVFALMLALLRHIPAAGESLRRGEWKRSQFRGKELNGKVLGIVGLGRIGVKVAERARAFGMTVCAYDPFVAPGQAESLSVVPISLDELLRRSDIITLHVPAAADTQGLIGARELALCKPGAYLINCSRGSVVSGDALLQALDSGKLAGAGLDVFEREPPVGSPLLQHPKVVATPHIAGMTDEAQRNVALAVARQVLDVLQGRQPAFPVNAPALSPEQQARIGPHLDLARRLGKLYAGIAAAPTAAVEVSFAGQATELEPSLLTSAVLEGMLVGASDTPVNLVNARLIARNRGISVSETTSAESGPYASLISLVVGTPAGEHRLAGTVMQGQPYVVSIEDYPLLFIPAGTLLYTEHIEQPGILGRMGTALGDLGVNISFVQVGRHSRGGPGIMILGIDDAADGPVLAAVSQLPSVVRACMIRLPPS